MSTQLILKKSLLKQNSQKDRVIMDNPPPISIQDSKSIVENKTFTYKLKEQWKSDTVIQKLKKENPENKDFPDNDAATEEENIT